MNQYKFDACSAAGVLERYQDQLDPDGIKVGVPRQALDEVLTELWNKQHVVEQACAVVDECVDTQSDVFIERYLTSDMEDIKSVLKQALRDKFKEGE